jgi:hypothetical protein
MFLKMLLEKTPELHESGTFHRTPILSVAALLNPRGFAPEFAQVINFSPANPAASNDFDFVDDGRMKREDTLNPNTV